MKTIFYVGTAILVAVILFFLLPVIEVGVICGEGPIVTQRVFIITPFSYFVFLLNGETLVDSEGISCRSEQL